MPEEKFLIEDFEYFKEFVEKETKKISFYERLCQTFPPIIKAPKIFGIKDSIETSIWLTNLKITSDQAFSTAIFSTLISIIFFTLITFLYKDAIILILTFPPLIFFNLLTYPKFYSEVVRIRASNESVSVLLYVISYLSLNPVYENSILFAASKSHGPLGNDMKRAIWYVYEGRFPTIKQAISQFSKKWSLWNEEFVNSLISLQLIEFATTEEKRNDILRNAIERLLSKNYKKMEEYVQNLRNPSYILLFMGIMLPLMGLVTFPLISIFLADKVNPAYMVIGYLIILPAFLWVFLFRILSKRPGSYTFSEKTEEVQPAKYIKLGKAKIPILPVAIMIGLIISTPGILHFVELTNAYITIFSTSRNLEEAKKNWGQYTLHSYSKEYIVKDSIRAMTIIWGVGFAIVFAYYFRSNVPYKFDLFIRKLEEDFEYGLFELHSVLRENVPIEIGILKVINQYEKINKKDSPIVVFFNKIYEKLVKGMKSLYEIIFGKEGIIYLIPSSMVKNIIGIVISAISKGGVIASRIAKNISTYLSKLREIEEMIKKVTAEVIANLEMQGKFITPFLSGIVAGAAVIIVQMLNGIAQFLKSFQQMSIGVAIGENLDNVLNLIKIQETIPPTVMLLTAGLYMIETIIIVVYFQVGILRGFNKVHREYLTYKTLLQSLIMFSIISMMLIGMFQGIYEQMMGKL